MLKNHSVITDNSLHLLSEAARKMDPAKQQIVEKLNKVSAGQDKLNTNVRAGQRNLKFT
jgi:hypothetical protein